MLIFFLPLRTAPEAVGDKNRPKFFKANFNPLKLTFLRFFFGSSWAKLNVVYVLKKQAKKLIFAPKIALRVERSDPDRNHKFRADF
jgi:hypothetical protein